MRIVSTVWISFFALCFGLFFFALKQEFIIIRLPGYHHGLLSHDAQSSSYKKTITLYIKSRDSWKTEQHQLLWTSDIAENMRLLTTSWLNFALEEKKLDKKILIQSCALSTSGQELYLSFESNPLPKEQSIFEKWQLIEGLLKTIRENKIPLVSIHFLVHHKPLQDPHLSFDLPWPINGFFE